MSVQGDLFGRLSLNEAAMLPGEVEVRGWFRQHLGPRMSSAGVGLQFHCNQEPGIYFKVDTEQAYQDAIARQVRRSLDKWFPDFPSSASVWVTHLDIDEVDTSEMALIKATHMAVGQAYLLKQSGDYQ